MRILLADDQEEIRLLTKQRLESSGHHVVAVADGEEALRALRRGPFDVVLLDEQMPGMTGTEVLRAITPEERRARHCAFIALTGYDTETDRERLLQAGFDAVLGKPFRFDTLEAALGVAVEAKPAGTSPAVVLPSSQRPSGDPLQRLGGDRDLLCDLARTFMRDLRPRLAKIRSSIREKRGGTLASTAHALKGSLSIFAGDKAAALCRELQECANSGRFADAARSFDALQEAIAELEPNLRGYAGQKRAPGPPASRASKTKRGAPDSK